MTCKINQIFNVNTEKCEDKKCKVILEYYSEKKKRCEKRPLCKNDEKFNERIEKCKKDFGCKLNEYYSEKKKNV